MKGRRFTSLIWGCVYVASVLCITDAMWSARMSQIAQFEASKSRTDWRAWQAAVEQMGAKADRLARRPPPGREPPSLVLMRDYFPTCLVGILSTFTALYIVLATMISGAIRTRKAAAHLAYTTHVKPVRVMSDVGHISESILDNL